MLWLASDEARYVTGIPIPVEGGMLQVPIVCRPRDAVRVRLSTDLAHAALGRARLIHVAPEPSSALNVANVLVPLDGSELALQAMPTARVLAQRFNATLSTVTVADGEADTDRARAYAAAALGVDHGDDRVHVLSEGEPAEVITRRAAALSGCIVCMATHGRGRLGGALVGSVARGVVQKSDSPVVTLGPSADNPGWSPRPRNWPEPLTVARIVACVDGSTASEQVLPFAAVWAEALDMSLTVLTVIVDAPTPLRLDHTPGPFGPHGNAEAYVDHLVQQWQTRISRIDGVVVRDPIGPASGMRAHLDEHPAGLVALTTHARSGLQRALLGATAASIVHSSVAPCLVAPVRT
ncbi:universal stress protein [Aquihabitans daechungensis]|uniref:universal stress protein n=1 Tax=Aquihabitans daechungensis TaxID=1052257 RepID=UPI003BA2AA84